MVAFVDDSVVAFAEGFWTIYVEIVVDFLHALHFEWILWIMKDNLIIAQLDIE